MRIGSHCEKCPTFPSFLHPLSARSERMLGLWGNDGAICCIQRTNQEIYPHVGSSPFPASLLLIPYSCFLGQVACFLGSDFWGVQAKTPGSSLFHSLVHRVLLYSPTWITAMLLSVDPNLILRCYFFQDCFPWCPWPQVFFFLSETSIFTLNEENHSMPVSPMTNIYR